MGKKAQSWKKEIDVARRLACSEEGGIISRWGDDIGLGSSINKFQNNRVNDPI